LSRGLSFRHVEVIRAVVLTGTATGAAAQLHVTQPAVSNVLKDAEERLGFVLFERAGGRLIPTEKAKLLVAEIERAFTGLDTINEVAALLGHNENRRLHIVTTPSFGAAVLPRVIQQFRARYPNVRMSLSSRASNLVQSMVVSQKADIGFGLEVPAIPGVRQEGILRTPLHCIVAHDHPLAGRDRVDALDLHRYDMVSFSHLSEGTEDQISCLFDRAPSPPESIVDCATSITVCALVESGVGFALSHSLVLHLFRHAALRALAFSPETHLGICAYRADCSQYPAAELDYLVELAREESRAIDVDFHRRMQAANDRPEPGRASR